MSFLDFIDPASGRVTERIDTSAIKDGGVWAGFAGDDLAFYSGFGIVGASQPYVALVAID